jgi:hypothetical protein
MRFRKKKMIHPKRIRRRRRGYNTSDNGEAEDYENIPDDVIPEASQAEHDKSVHELINATREHKVIAQYSWTNNPVFTTGKFLLSILFHCQKFRHLATKCLPALAGT